MSDVPASPLAMARPFTHHRRLWFGSAAVLLLIVVSWLGVLDAPSNDYVDSAIVRSTVAYAAARGLNGVVSVLQSTTFSVSMLGGVSVTGGEILDPVNDLIEQYATLMKFAIGSLVIQKVLLEIVSHTFFKVLTTVAGAFVIGSLLTTGRPGLVLAMRTFVFVLFLRFMLVIVVMLNSVVSHYFIEGKTDGDVQSLSSISANLDESVLASAELQEARDAAAAALLVLEARSAAVAAELAALEEDMQNAGQALQSAEEALNVITSSIGFIERFTTESPALAAARQERDRLREARDALQTRALSLGEQRSELAQQITFNQNVVTGAPNTFLERMQGQWRNMASITDVYNIRDRLEDSSQRVINVMSLFVFETLLLPLFFLFVLSRGMSSVWRVNIRAD